MQLSDIVIVLCRPSEPGNVGAVCRAMKNMGLSRLRLVSPAPLDEEVILARTVHAEDIWEKTGYFDSLDAAISDCTLTIGTTRRRGHRRKAATMTPGETAAFLQTKPGSAALVFGNERTGLEDSELGLCNLASHIPADEVFPSLNLSHAVQIYAYELFRALNAPHREPGIEPGDTQGPADLTPGQWIPLDRPAVDSLVKSVSNSLESLGFYRHPGREEQERFLRDIFSRAGLTTGEARYMGNIFAKAARLGTLDKFM